MAAPESARSARRSRGKRPSSSSSPAWRATPIRLPAVSRTVTRRRVRTMMTSPSWKAFPKSNLRKVGASDGGEAATPCQGSSPRPTAMSVTARTPMMMAPGTFRDASPAMSKNPTAARRACGFDRLPRVTSVTGSSATMPAFCSPISARKSPMPAAMPSFRFMGRRSARRARATATARRRAGQRGTREQAQAANCHQARDHGEGEIGVEPHAGGERDG
jgi:hypothetical protein